MSYSGIPADLVALLPRHINASIQAFLTSTCLNPALLFSSPTGETLCYLASHPAPYPPSTVILALVQKAFSTSAAATPSHQACFPAFELNYPVPVVDSLSKYLLCLSWEGSPLCTALHHLTSRETPESLTNVIGSLLSAGDKCASWRRKVFCDIVSRVVTTDEREGGGGEVHQASTPLLSPLLQPLPAAHRLHTFLATRVQELKDQAFTQVFMHPHFAHAAGAGYEGVSLAHDGEAHGSHLYAAVLAATTGVLTSRLPELWEEAKAFVDGASSPIVNLVALWEVGNLGKGWASLPPPTPPPQVSQPQPQQQQNQQQRRQGFRLGGMVFGGSRIGGGRQYNSPPPHLNLPPTNTLCGVRAEGGESVGAFAARFAAARGGEGSVGKFAALYCAQFFKYLHPTFLAPRLMAALLALPGEDLREVVGALKGGGGGGAAHPPSPHPPPEHPGEWLYDEERGYALREGRARELLEGLGVLVVARGGGGIDDAGGGGVGVLLPYTPPPSSLPPPAAASAAPPGDSSTTHSPITLKEVPRAWIVKVRVAGGAERGAERAENLLGRGMEGWNKWLHPGGGGGSWMEVEFTHPLCIVAYAMQSANDVPDRDPRGWRVLSAQGGGEGGWVERHRVGEEVGGSPFSARWQWLQWGLSELGGSSAAGEGVVKKVRIEFTGARQQWGSDGGSNLQVGHVAFFTK